MLVVPSLLITEHDTRIARTVRGMSVESKKPVLGPGHGGSLGDHSRRSWSLEMVCATSSRPCRTRSSI